MVKSSDGCIANLCKTAMDACIFYQCYNKCEHRISSDLGECFQGKLMPWDQVESDGIIAYLA